MYSVGFYIVATVRWSLFEREKNKLYCRAED